jgi:excisionase family DNA binding protein
MLTAPSFLCVPEQSTSVSWAGCPNSVDFYTMKLTVPLAARRVGRSPETVRRWIWSGRLPSEKVGNQHLVDVEALDALTGGATAEGRGSRVKVGGEWGKWLGRADALGVDFRGKRIPPVGDLVRESRRGH